MYLFIVYANRKKYNKLSGYSCKGKDRYSVLYHLSYKFPNFKIDELKTALFRGYIKVEYDLLSLL